MIKTTYQFDIYGNRVEATSDGTYKKSSYNDKNQLTTIKNNLDKTITYEYDGMGERISQHEEDDEIYQLKSYYEVSEELNLQDYRDGLEESNMDEAFAALKARQKQDKTIEDVQSRKRSIGPIPIKRKISISSMYWIDQ